MSIVANVAQRTKLVLSHNTVKEIIIIICVPLHQC